MVSILALSKTWFFTKAPKQFSMNAFIVLHGVILHCWWYHNWHGYYGGVTSFIIAKPGFFERLARTLGQVSNLLPGLLLLSLNKSDSLNNLVGISWKHMLVVHRSLGNLFLIVSMFHILSWWKVFEDQGVFPHNALSGVIFSAPTYFPLNMHAKPDTARN